MKKIPAVMGVLCLVYVVLSLVVSFLPAVFWQKAADFIMGDTPNTYYKIVPKELNDVHIIIFTIIGLALIALGLFVSKE